MAKRPRVLVDSSVIISALNSAAGAPALVIQAGRGDNRVVDLVVTPYITAEVERVIRDNFPQLAEKWLKLQEERILRTVKNPTIDNVTQAAHLIDDPKDTPIVAAALLHKVDYLVTLDRKHFLENDRLAKIPAFETIHASELVAELLSRASLKK